MGSSISHYDDELRREEWRKDKEWLKELAKEIEYINPSTEKFRDLKWLINNTERIIGNRQLINLLR